MSSIDYDNEINRGEEETWEEGINDEEEYWKYFENSSSGATPGYHGNPFDVFKSNKPLTHPLPGWYQRTDIFRKKDNAWLFSIFLDTNDRSGKTLRVLYNIPMKDTPNLNLFDLNDNSYKYFDQRHRIIINSDHWIKLFNNMSEKSKFALEFKTSAI